MGTAGLQSFLFSDFRLIFSFPFKQFIAEILAVYFCATGFFFPFLLLFFFDTTIKMSSQFYILIFLLIHLKSSYGRNFQ